MVTPWNERPAEVRLMILEMLLADGEPREPRQLSKLATVCKDWQDLFEKENWKRLCLTSACIVDFDRLVVGRRRRYLQNIWIRGHIKDLTSGTPGIPSSVIDLSRMLLSLSTWDESEAPSSLMVVYSAHETMEPFDPRVNVQKHIYSEPGRNEGSDLALICSLDLLGPADRCVLDARPGCNEQAHPQPLPSYHVRQRPLQYAQEYDGQGEAARSLGAMP